VSLPLISAGELFELLRTAAFFLSALISILVLASTLRRRPRLYVVGLLWSVGTFFLPLVVLPIYLIVLIISGLLQPSRRSNRKAESEPHSETQSLSGRQRFVLTAVYGFVLLTATSLYLYRDHNSVDAHLARATQAKLSSQPLKTISEYRAALALGDNPHTHKLLGVELVEAGDFPGALIELRTAQRGGESDDLLPFRIAQVLVAEGDHNASVPEYQRFLDSHACRQERPDNRCEMARAGVVQRGR
jgi:hypothetical protein